MSRPVTAKAFPYVRRPPDVDFGHASTIILVAILHGATTYEDIMATTGRSRSVVATHLGQLRDAGLVAWEPGHKGTLRPTCVPVRFG